jgi:drug/metabolite transporter (DMT)-like permease
MVAWVSLLIVWLVWGSTYLAIRVGVETIPPLRGCAIVGVLLLVANGAVGIGEKTVPSGLAALLVATVATYAYVNPVIAVLLGTLILNERLTPVMFGGGALIVGAVVLVVRRSPAAH